MKNSSDKTKKQISLINRLVSLAIASAKIKTIEIQQKKRVWKGLYPPISLYIYAGYGSLKTTLLEEIEKKTGEGTIKKCTAAGLVGSIDDGRGLISPVWDHRGKVMAIDEFNVKGESGTETKQAILDIIEKGKYRKNIGRAVKNNVNIKDENLFFRIKEGGISFKTRCGAVICTMVKHTADTFHMALLSRCIPLSYSIDDPEMIFTGEIEWKIVNHKVKEHVKISLKDWEYIYRFSMDHSINDKIRTASMLARVYAVLGKHDDELYGIICALRNDVENTSVKW